MYSAGTPYLNWGTHLAVYRVAAIGVWGDISYASLNRAVYLSGEPNPPSPDGELVFCSDSNIKYFTANALLWRPFNAWHDIGQKSSPLAAPWRQRALCVAFIMVQNGLMSVHVKSLWVTQTTARRADADGNLFSRCVKRLQYIMDFKLILLYHVSLNLYFIVLLLIQKSEKWKT